MLLQFAINRALKKPAPFSYSVTRPGSLSHDFCSVRFESLEGDEKILVYQKDHDVYKGFRWGVSGDREDVIFDSRELNVQEYSMQIVHFYKGHEFSFCSAAKFLIFNIFRLHRLLALRERASQFWYNQKQLLRHERIDVLRHMIDRKLENHNDIVNTVSLLMTMESRKFIYHPDKEKHLARLKLILDSFVTSGDVKIVSSGYVITPQAFITLTSHALDEQYHNDQVKAARVGNKLSCVIGVIGVLGVGAQFVMWGVENEVNPDQIYNWLKSFYF